jgi:hypothetical protein
MWYLSVPCVRVPAKPAGRWVLECPGRGLTSGHRAEMASGGGARSDEERGRDGKEQVQEKLKENKYQQ